MQVIWLKHDLRLADHAPLRAALASGEHLCLLYVVEPERMEQPDESVLHGSWDLANARSLLQQVETLGGTMQIRVGKPEELSLIHI